MVRYWKEFGHDILVDMIGFRKYGHNEVDEPAFTQPKMYKKIRTTDSLPVQYAKQLIKDGVIKKDKHEKMLQQINQHFEEEFKLGETLKPSLKDTRDPTFKGSRSLTHKWKDMEFSELGKDA